MKAECTDCHERIEVGMLLGKKIGGMIGASLLGGGAVLTILRLERLKRDHPLLAGIVSIGGSLLGAYMGSWVGQMIDERWLSRCPRCQGTLRVIEELVN